MRIFAGITTGGLAVLLAQPTDVVKVRMQAEARSTTGIKRYSGTMNAYSTIARKEGIAGLWKGKINYKRRSHLNVDFNDIPFLQERYPTLAGMLSSTLPR